MENIWDSIPTLEDVFDSQRCMVWDISSGIVEQITHMFEGINEVAILVTSILSVAVGSVWYSPLFFGAQWMNAAGLSTPDLAMTEKQILARVLMGIVANMVLFYVLARFIAASRVAEVSIWGIGLALVLFLSASMVSMVMWEKRSWLYIIIHIGYAATVIFGGLGVLAYWPW